jgi:hypothetical protein
MSTHADDTLESTSAAENYVAPQDGNRGGTARTAAENAPVTNWATAAPVYDVIVPIQPPVAQVTQPTPQKQTYAQWYGQWKYDFDQWLDKSS